MSLVTLSRHDAVAVVSMNDPDRRNALSPQMRAGLLAALDPLMGDDACRAIVLTGAGGDFCAGGDLKSMRPGEPLAARHRLMTGYRLVRLLAGGPKPVIAAVEGAAFGAGLSLAALADHCVAAEGARFGAAFGKVGLMADMGLLWALPGRIGMARTRRFLLLNQTFDATEALASGMADESAPAGAALDRAIEWARDYAAMAPLVVAATRAAFAGLPRGLDDVLAMELDLQSALMASADHAEGRAAFLEKRAPAFRGR